MLETGLGIRRVNEALEKRVSIGTRMASTEVIKRTRDKCQFCMKGQKGQKSDSEGSSQEYNNNNFYYLARCRVVRRALTDAG